ncbi:UBC-like protein [Conidiobolus coronatus NRRL 28638]|uniref:UBC-like protein n=1 Tax=Conidiobolus coronatus (strain ATCC 28846 / CBS 209.66 / NRRL 28638) TaxID=796925 RepID=A0A137P8S6_CONC2|nr:UBC-like protein [Conidiobolus coronatus NRRL 28638]|eukprot:KXN71354.1 UBC-like protein [Conidiobolus coronatus NRRL 28638]
MSKLKLNDKNPSIKRILRELKDLNENPSSQFCVEALEDNLFDLHFTILGPQGTEFETGRYHGRIVLPNEYPFKPPNIMLLTPNGRFQLFTKICLSITGYHPEFWQPAWGIRTVLVALISFLNEKAEGAIGGIDTSKEERQRLAKL